MANIRAAGYSQRLAGWCGIAFAVLLFIALVLVFPPDAESKNGAAILADYYAKKSTQVNYFVASIIFPFAGVLFLWFLGRLYARLRTAEGEDGYSGLAFAGGVVFSGLLMVSMAVTVVFALTLNFSKAFRLNPNAALLFNTLDFYVLVLAMAGAAVLLVATGLAGRRSRLLPRWLARVSYVLAVLCLPPVSGIFVFFPLLLFLIWIVIVSVTMIRGIAAGDETVTTGRLARGVSGRTT